MDQRLGSVYTTIEPRHPSVRRAQTQRVRRTTELGRAGPAVRGARPDPSRLEHRR